MTSDSIVNVTEAQAKLNRLINQDSFAISRHGKIVGIYRPGTGRGPHRDHGIAEQFEFAAALRL
jgi:hypothetical protein